MKIINYITPALVFFLSACGNSKSDLASKKAELDRLKSEIARLQSEAVKLEDEIGKLEPKKESGKLVETLVLASGEFSSYLTINGKADADQSTFATSQVPATVTSVLVKSGSRVTKGQALAHLDNAALKQNRMVLENQLSFANTLYLKQKRLFEKGVGTEVQYLSAKNQKESLEKNLAAMDAQLAMYTVKSPINGTVESVETKVGQIASPGMPLFKVVNLNDMKVIADVAESYSGKITANDKVTVYFPDLDKTINTRISFVSKLIDPLNRTFRIEINIPKAEGIKPNMTASLQIMDYTKSDCISVPTNCIQSAEEQKYVVVVLNNNGKSTAKRVAIKTGRNGGDYTEVLEGLKEGDNIVVNGYQELIDGQSVSVVPQKSN